MRSPPAPEHPYASFVHRVEKPGALPRRRARRAAEGLGERRGARLPRVPRRLRHRDEPPRLQDPLQDPERRPAHPGRARVRAVDRHGGASSARAGCRSSRSRARGRCATSTSSASRCSSSSRTPTSCIMLDLGGIPLRADARGEDDPLVIAGGPDGDAPGAARAVPRRRRHRRRRGARDRGRARRGRGCKKQGVPRAERLRALAKLAGVYVPSLYATRVDAGHGLHRGRPRARARGARCPSSARSSTT